MIQLSHFQVFGLFVLFDHQISFRIDERVTIIHAPNGFGKTAILKMIAGLFGGSLLVFRQYEFSEVRFVFTDGRVLLVKQTKFEGDEKRRQPERRYDLMMELDGEVIERWSPWDEKLLDSLPERFRYDLVSSAEEYRDPRTGQRLDPAEAWEKFSHYFPRSRPGLPTLIAETRQLFDCRLLVEDGSREKIRKLETKTPIRGLLIGACLQLGCLRLYSLQAGVNLRFKELRYRFWGRKLECNLDEMIKEVFDHSQIHTGQDRAKAFVEQYPFAKVDPLQLVSGHDLIASLGIALQSLIGSRNAMHCSVPEIESKLRLGFSMADFEKTSVYAHVKSWENKNPPFKCLH